MPTDRSFHQEFSEKSRELKGKLVKIASIFSE